VRAEDGLLLEPTDYFHFTEETAAAAAAAAAVAASTSAHGPSEKAVKGIGERRCG
jgi:hypothetical protein